VNNEIYVTVLFVTVELEINDHDVVDQCKQKKAGLITHNLLHGEHVPAVFSSKTCDGCACKAFAFYKLVDCPFEFDHVHKLEDGEEKADHDESVVCN
jgi:hypothetical protein